MYLTLRPTLTLPFVDVDRKGGQAPKGARIGARTVIVLAYVVAFVGWMVWRWA
jgi:hypothetical protein